MSTPEELKTLKRIEELLAVVARALLAEPLKAAIKDRQHKFLYENTGKLPVKELAKKTGLSTATISRTWQRWEQDGLLIKDGKQYRKVLEP